MSAVPQPLPWWRALHWQILAALVLAGLGAAVLSLLGLADRSSPPMVVARFVADLFLRLLKMAIVPLVFATVSIGIASIDVKRLGSLGFRAFA